MITGLLISWFFAIPTITVLIDRSYCPPIQWQQVSQTYTDLLQKAYPKTQLLGCD